MGKNVRSYNTPLKYQQDIKCTCTSGNPGDFPGITHSFLLQLVNLKLLQHHVFRVCHHFELHDNTLLTPVCFRTPSFEAGDIYATAFAASADFHYTISVMIDSRTCMKYHATERATGYFNFEARNQTLADSNTLCVALKIGGSCRPAFVELSNADTEYNRPPPELYH